MGHLFMLLKIVVGFYFISADVAPENHYHKMASEMTTAQIPAELVILSMHLN